MRHLFFLSLASCYLLTLAKSRKSKLGQACKVSRDCVSQHCLPKCESNNNLKLCVEPAWVFQRHSVSVPSCVNDLLIQELKQLKSLTVSQLGEKCHTKSNCFSQQCIPECHSSFFRCIEPESFYARYNLRQPKCVEEKKALSLVSSNNIKASKNIGEPCVLHSDCVSDNCIPICENPEFGSLCIENKRSFEFYKMPYPTCIERHNTIQLINIIKIANRREDIDSKHDIGDNPLKGLLQPLVGHDDNSNDRVENFADSEQKKEGAVFNNMLDVARNKQDTKRMAVGYEKLKHPKQKYVKEEKSNQFENMSAAQIKQMKRMFRIEKERKEAERKRVAEENQKKQRSSVLEKIRKVNQQRKEESTMEEMEKLREAEERAEEEIERMRKADKQKKDMHLEQQRNVWQSSDEEEIGKLRMAEQVQQGMEPFFNQAEELQKAATELHVGEKQIAEGNDIGEEKLMSENELRSGIDYQMQSRMDVNGKENIPGVMEEPIINTVFEEGNEKHGGAEIFETVQGGMQRFFTEANTATELQGGEKQIVEENDIGEEKLMFGNELRSVMDDQMKSRMDVNEKEINTGVRKDQEEQIINTVFEEGNEKHGSADIFETVQGGMQRFFIEAKEVEKTATELQFDEKQFVEGNDIVEEKLMSENELRSVIDNQMRLGMDVNEKEIIAGAIKEHEEEDQIINNVFEEEKHEDAEIIEATMLRMGEGKLNTLNIRPTEEQRPNFTGLKVNDEGNFESKEEQDLFNQIIYDEEKLKLAKENERKLSETSLFDKVAHYFF